MLDRIFTGSPKPSIYRCLNHCGKGTGEEGVSSRHEGIYGYDQKKFSASSVTLVGGGGINGEIGEGLVRKGIGFLSILDGDTVDLSNLNRQRFYKCDLGQNKAVRLGRNLAPEGFVGTVITAYPFYFQEAVELGHTISTDLIVCGVDNDETRTYVAQYALQHTVPAIYSAVSRDANQGYVFVQLPGEACFGCAFPSAVSNMVTPCPGVPAIMDILKVIAGVVLYAIDTVLMDRKRNWNYRVIHLAGFMPDVSTLIEKRASCQICQNQGD